MAPAYDSTDAPVPRPVSGEVVIRMEGVQKWYDSFHVLKDIELEVRKGERIVICGPSGSGKSTLIRCINQLEKHQKGTITVNGITLDSHHRHLDQVRREVGMVFQQFNLFPHLTVMQNCMLAPMKVRGIAKAEAQAIAMTYLERVRIPEQADKYPGQLSGGQQQRVAIARALAMQPIALLCDEITSALDPELVSEVLAVVKELACEGMTLLMVTHEMRFARDVCSRVVFMHQGRVHEIGPPEEVFATPKTPELQQFLGVTH